MRYWHRLPSEVVDAPSWRHKGVDGALSCRSAVGVPVHCGGVGTPWKIPSTSNDSIKQRNAVFDFCWHRRSGAAFRCFPRGTPLPRARSPGLPAASCHRRLVAAQRPSRRRSPAPYLRAPRGAAAAAGTVLRCCPQLPGRAPPGPGSGLLLPAGDTAGREAGLRLGQVGAGAAGRGDAGTKERDRNETGTSRAGTEAAPSHRAEAPAAAHCGCAGREGGADVTSRRAGSGSGRSFLGGEAARCVRRGRAACSEWDWGRGGGATERDSVPGRVGKVGGPRSGVGAAVGAARGSRPGG